MRTILLNYYQAVLNFLKLTVFICFVDILHTSQVAQRDVRENPREVKPFEPDIDATGSQ